MTRPLWHIYRHWMYRSDNIGEIVSMISVDHLCSLEVFDLQRQQIRTFSSNISQCIDTYWMLCEGLRLEKPNQLELSLRSSSAFNWLCADAKLLDRERFITGLLAAIQSFCRMYDELPNTDSLLWVKNSASDYRVHATDLLLQLGDW